MGDQANVPVKQIETTKPDEYYLGPFLLTQIILNPSMGGQSHAKWYVR